MNSEKESVPHLETTDVSSEVVVAEIVDPEARQETDRLIGDIVQSAGEVDASRKMAEEALRAAQLAKEHSAGLGRKREAIETIQDALVAASNAIASLAESQEHLFDNQRKFAEYIGDLTSFALGSVANMRLVYRRLQAKLAGASQDDLTELARHELQGVMQEFKLQLDLSERQEQMNNRLLQLRKDHAERLDNVVEDLEHQREVDRLFNESLLVAFGRLDSVELTAASTASGLTTEGVRGEQRDESIAQLFALARSVEDANRQSSAAIADSARSTIESISRLRRQLQFVLCTAASGVVLGAVALLLTLLH